MTLASAASNLEEGSGEGNKVKSQSQKTNLKGKCTRREKGSKCCVNARQKDPNTKKVKEIAVCSPGLQVTRGDFQVK